MATPDITQAKRELRREIRARLRALPVGHRDREARRITANWEWLVDWGRCRVVMVYSPLPTEVDLRAILDGLREHRVRVGFPCVDGSTGGLVVRAVDDPAAECTPGCMGILEPGPGCPRIAPGEIDVVLVPGLAFAVDGRRLGRGGGYYDRFLPLTRAWRVAVAYDEQVVDSIPTTATDQRVHVLVTPTRVVRNH